MFPQTELITERLRLVPITPAHVRAFYKSRTEFSTLLGVNVSKDWPVEPIILEILKEHLDDPAAFAWADYIYVHKADGCVSGDGGFKGPPDADGRVEIGYAIIPEYRNKGLGTEAARALLDQAFSHGEVKTICAETTVNGLASMAVLRKLGMQNCGSRHDEENGNFFCWQITRERY